MSGHFLTSLNLNKFKIFVKQVFVANIKGLFTKGHALVNWSRKELLSVGLSDIQVFAAWRVPLRGLLAEQSVIVEPLFSELLFIRVFKILLVRPLDVSHEELLAGTLGQELAQLVLDLVLVLVQDLLVFLLSLAKVAGRSAHHVILQLFEALILRVDCQLLLLTIVNFTPNHALHLL